MTQVAKHAFALAAALLITTVSFSQTVALPSRQAATPAATLLA